MRDQVVFHNTTAACLLRRIKVKAVGGSLDDTRKFVTEETRGWSDVIRKAA